jgi:MFS family permease
VLGLLLLRAALSQMDVPTRTSYVMAVVTPPERTAAASFTTVPRSIAAAIGPAIAGAMYAAGWQTAPFILCGVLKILYDFALLAAFRHVRPPEEV